MGTRSLRQLTTVGAVALTTLATAAACTSAPVRVLPNTATPSPASPSATAPAGTASPSATTPSTKPVRVATSRAPTPPRPITRPTRCLGAVKYTIDAAKTGPPRSSLCIAVGGVVEVRNLGPDGLSISPANKVSCFYEAAVHSCRLIQTGTVTFVLTRETGNRIITVVVTKKSSPAKPSPACLGARTTHTVDAAANGPDWPALCVKIGAVLRIENLGPDGLSVSPASRVSCFYEAAVHLCRFVRPGTVTFTIAGLQTRTLTVVAIR
jgi:hypothetical protein